MPLVLVRRFGLWIWSSACHVSAFSADLQLISQDSARFVSTGRDKTLSVIADNVAELRS
jgi:hypothetical protein